MIRIAMVIPTLDSIGGAEREVMLLAQALSARGWQVTVLALSGTGGAAREELAAAGVVYFSLQMRKAWIDPRGWGRYLKWAAANQPQIIHTHLPHATWFARCIRLFVPVHVQIDTIHTSNPGSRARRLTYRLTSCLTDRVTCVSAAVAAAAKASSLAPRSTLAVLHNGVVIPANSALLTRTQFLCSDQSFHWLAIGRLAPVKDYPNLRAFKALPGMRNPHHEPPVVFA